MPSTNDDRQKRMLKRHSSAARSQVTHRRDDVDRQRGPRTRRSTSQFSAQRREKNVNGRVIDDRSTDESGEEEPATAAKTKVRRCNAQRQQAADRREERPRNQSAHQNLRRERNRQSRVEEQAPDEDSDHRPPVQPLVPNVASESTAAGRPGLRTRSNGVVAQPTTQTRTMSAAEQRDESPNNDSDGSGSTPPRRRELRSGRRPTPAEDDATPKPQETDELIRLIGGKRIRFVREEWNRKKNYDYAQKVELKLQLEEKKNTMRKPEKEEIGRYVEEQYKELTHKYVAYHLWSGCGKSAKELLEELAKKRKQVPTQAELDRIQKIIDDGPENLILKPGTFRWKMEVGSLPMFISDEQKDVTISKSSIDFKHETTNTVKPPGDRNLRRVMSATLEQESGEEFHCKCNGPCTSKCPCAIRNQVFEKSNMKYRRHGTTTQDHEKEIKKESYKPVFKCGESCACKGKCKSSIVFPREEYTEVLLHPTRPEKGFVARARQFFSKGELVAEMTGEIQSTTEAQFNTYSLEVTHADEEIMPKQIMKSKFNLSEQYTDNLKEIFEHGFTLDPEKRSTVGRFMANSCLGNTRCHYVYTDGLSPMKVRVLYMTTQIVAPNMELTWGYGDNYIFTHLADDCACGQPCCITNRDIYHLITEDHIKYFYTKLYEQAFADYNRYVLKPIKRKQEKKQKEGNAQSQATGPAAKRTKLAKKP